MPDIAMPAAEMLAPLKFVPVYMERIWGGTLMSEYLMRQLPEHSGPIGEAWELCDRNEVNSVVAEGALAGVTLNELVTHYGSALLGRKGANCRRFPLLVKLIDAGERLSLQVHPDEAACRILGNGAEPKTEMWYIIASRPGAQILAGLHSRASKLQLMQLLDSPEVVNQLQVYASHPGDAYYITSGTLHAIGGGNLILEIQQNSDTTYRISDWGRVDANGNSRELHKEPGVQAINFTNRCSPRIAGVSGVANLNRKFEVVNMCPHFHVTELHLCSPWKENTAQSSSFHLISSVSHQVEIGKDERKIVLQPGETALVPAVMGIYTITPLEEGECVVIRTTL